MRARRAIGGCVVALVVACTVGCGGDSGSSGAEFTSGGGSYRITKVKISDRYPADCTDRCLIGPSGSSSSQQLQAGLELIVVTTESQSEGSDGKGLGASCPGESVYVTASDGSRHSCTAGGYTSGGEAGFDLLFGVPAGATGFKLHVPDNEPIELDE
jgi:hypothetical protein